MNVQLQKELLAELPEGFTARGATMDDVERAMQLFNRWSRAVIGRDEFTDLESIREEWKAPGADPAEDVRLIFAPDGALVGYIEVWPTARSLVHPELWARLDPRYEDMGIGTWMMRWSEERALRALPDVPARLRFAPHVGTYRQAEKAKNLFEAMGYRHIRSTYHMVIEMDAPVPEA